jgi:hypothetical protein
MIAILAIDPGGSTGVAYGVFDARAKDRDVGDILRTGVYTGSTTIQGDEYAQIREIARLWTQFFRKNVQIGQMDPDSVEFVSEDFILRPGSHGGGKEGISPVRILWGVEGYRMGREDEFKGRRNSKHKLTFRRPVILQTAGQAATYASNQRLRDWDLWVVGKEHERSAWRHIALRVATLHGQGRA